MKASNNLLTEYHSRGGPLTVSTTLTSPLINTFMQGGQELGFDHIDCNGKTQEGIHRTRSIWNWITFHCTGQLYILIYIASRISKEWWFFVVYFVIDIKVPLCLECVQICFCKIPKNELLFLVVFGFAFSVELGVSLLMVWIQALLMTL